MFYAYFTHGPKQKRIRTVRQYSRSLAHPRGMYYNGKEGRKEGRITKAEEAKVSPGDCSLVRRFCSPKVRKSEIKGSSFRRFCSPKVRKSDNDIDSFLL